MPFGKIASIMVFGGCLLLRPAASQAGDSHPAPTISSLLSTYALETQTADDRASRNRAMVRRFYAGNGDRPAWADKRFVAAELLHQLADAERYGLRADGYLVPPPPAGEAAQSPDWPAGFDLALTAAALRFLSDLHFGRSAPDFKWYGGSREPDDFDPVEHLRQALAQGTFAPAITAAEPRLALYARVKQTLANYRELARRHGQWAPLPPQPAPPASSKLLLYSGVAALWQRLALLGDLEESAAAADAGMSSAALEAGLKHFQARHGLTPDGILGPATMSALAIPLADRVRQLELTLERLRWMPGLPPGQLIVVNVPSYRLWAFDTKSPPGSVEADMRVIVGNAARTPTPLLIAQLRYLEFNPAWNVPRSIEVEELIPKLARDPALLYKEDFELVPRERAASNAAGSPLALLRSGAMRLRQRPGPRNPLGPVKFGMPNPQNIYLHGTSAKELFARTRRDLSHGCIRLEHPEELATFVLRNEGQWDRASVLAAMEPGPSRTVTLRTPIPVVLLYATALTDRQGRAIFLLDTYGLDKKLARALVAEAVDTGHGFPQGAAIGWPHQPTPRAVKAAPHS
ncbi:L,D-transpeptidase family protein [Pseudoduganella sp. OTU4001]|uniref:L,D-transpeptidase family protein n=1 Tax=Pseudoduganella sp. OTU4001 TaxID=3043854 RepID=UPI00313B4A7B